MDTKIKTQFRDNNRGANQIIGNLVETGLQAKEPVKRRFFELAEKFLTGSSLDEVNATKAVLAALIFGN